MNLRVEQISSGFSTSPLLHALSSPLLRGYDGPGEEGISLIRYLYLASFHKTDTIRSGADWTRIENMKYRPIPAVVFTLIFCYLFQLAHGFLLLRILERESSFGQNERTSNLYLNARRIRAASAPLKYVRMKWLGLNKAFQKQIANIYSLFVCA